MQNRTAGRRRKKKKPGQHLRCWRELDDQARGKFRNVKSLVGNRVHGATHAANQLAGVSSASVGVVWSPSLGEILCVKSALNAAAALSQHPESILTHTDLLPFEEEPHVVATMAVLRKLLM